ncbi:MAG: hypothetical protein IT196_05790 [Acidimicrobiales bacterium]|nr:hypothetical protein [Acidimicrobiales bacterium]
MARLKALSGATRERLAAVIETALNRCFDSPYDIRNAYEAMQAINPTETGAGGQGAVRKLADWGAARAATRIGTKYGAKVAGRAVAPIGMAVEFGLSARDGIRELQVLTSFLVTRFRLEGYRPDKELIRRTVLAVYLQPKVRPDLKVPMHRRSLAVAKRWSVNTLPLTGRMQSSQTRQRVDAIAVLPLAQLHEDWQRVSALDGDEPAPTPRVIEARVVERPDGRTPPPPPRG